MSVLGYFTDHWIMLISLISTLILLLADVHLEPRMIRRIAIICGMLLVYSVSCYAETYLGNQIERSVFRPILGAVNYSLVSFILVEIIMIVFSEQKSYLLFPAIINTVFSFISIPTGIVFSIDSENHFHRGTLGHLSYIVSGLYILYFFIRTFTSPKRQKEDYPLMIFVSITSVLCLLIPLFLYEATLHWFVTTIAIDILLYYVFLLQQFTKRDPLTHLLNRQSYFSDANKSFRNISALIAMDMNGLKEINDSKGHVEGDIALKKLADCFWKATKHKQRVYRIGGDEFLALCLNTSESEVKALIERIRSTLAETPYTCAIGYAMKAEGNTIDDLYHRADAMLYEDKNLYYKTSGKDRRRR